MKTKSLLLIATTLFTLGFISKPAWSQTSNSYNLCDASQMNQFQQVVAQVRSTSLSGHTNANAGSTITIQGSGFSSLPSSGLYAHIYASDYKCSAWSEHSAPVRIISDREMQFVLPSNVSNRDEPYIGEHKMEMLEIVYQSPNTRGCTIDPRNTSLNIDYLFGRASCDMPVPAPFPVTGYARSNTEVIINWQYPQQHKIDGFRVYKNTCLPSATPTRNVCAVPDASDLKNTRVWEEITNENNLVDPNNRRESITTPANDPFVPGSTVYFAMTSYESNLGESAASQMVRVNFAATGGSTANQQEAQGGIVNLRIRDFNAEQDANRKYYQSIFPYSVNSSTQHVLGGAAISYYDSSANNQPNYFVDSYTGEKSKGAAFYATSSADGSTTIIKDGSMYFRDAASGVQSNIIVDARYVIAGVNYFATAHLSYNPQTRTLTPVALIGGNATLNQEGIVGVSQSARSLALSNWSVTAPSSTARGSIRGTITGDITSIVPSFTPGGSIQYDQQGNAITSGTVTAHTYRNNITMEFSLPLNLDY